MYFRVDPVQLARPITSLGWGLHFPELWTNTPLGGATPHPGSGIHVAFHAPNAGAVDGFYAAALSAGGTDNGPPDYRLDYDPGYYGAFVLDPDRNKLVRSPESRRSLTTVSSPFTCIRLRKTQREPT